MPTPLWTPEPPSFEHPSSLRLRRVATSRISGYATSQTPVGVMLHWTGNRTMPCWRDTHCQHCLNGHTPRWKGYLTLYDPKTRAHWLQEYTPPCHQLLLDAFKCFGRLQGHLVAFERLRPSTNAPLTCLVMIQALPLDQLPPEPDIPALLQKIWKLDQNAAPQPASTTNAITHLRPIRGNGRPLSSENPLEKDPTTQL